MIKVLIVDDELPALKMAESVMKTFDDVLICGTFSDQDELMECIPNTDADLLLLDIKMPGVHGIELAGRINEIRPELSIVFVTAYDNYAIDAFSTETLDYILKPITEERMKITLERYKKRRRDLSVNETVKRIFVRSFGRFSVETESGEKMKFRTTKTEELFAFLLHHQGNYITKDKIIEELWYDRDADKAQSILYTTMYQLRKDLENFGLDNVVENSRKDGGVCRLAWSPYYWDCTEFLTILQQNKDIHVNIEKLKHAVEIYKNGYLTDNAYGWEVGKSIELEIYYFEIMENIIAHEITISRFEMALFYLKKWADLCPFDGGIHAKIIAVHLLMDNKDAAISYFDQVNETFLIEEGTQLGIDMDALFTDPFSVFK